MSSAFGVISVSSLIYAVKRASELSGNVSGSLALAVMLTFFMAVAGLVLGIMSVLEPDTYKFFPVTGIVLCSATIVSVIVMMLA